MINLIPKIIAIWLKLFQISNSILFAPDLQDTTLALDFRVTVLEETGGGSDNGSVAELEVRVETLEETAADHEGRLSAVENDVAGRSFVWI